MSHFSASETDRSLDLVSACQELLSAFNSDFEIMNVDLSGKANFLNVDNLLVAAGFLFLLCLLEAELSVVHNAANGGLSHRCDLDQIKSAFFGLVKCGLNVDYAQLSAVAVDKTNFFV